MKKKDELTVLLFRKDLEQAFVVTDGKHVRTYKITECEKFRSLSSAIAHLECQGYEIDTEYFH